MSTGTDYASPPLPPPTYASPPITLILTVLLLVFFFVGFFSIFFCRCFVYNILNTFNLGHSPLGNHVGISATNDNQGLDPSLVKSFPTFPYSSVKDFRCEKYGLECAICLSEFEDDDLLRLLTACYHVFHQECIDLWLESHKTCPVCRGNLDLQPDSLEKSPARVLDSDNHERNDPPEDAISIVIKDDDGEDRDGDGGREQGDPSRSEEQMDEFRENEQRFSRSHSTGHSIFRSREEKDKYKLTLPEHVKVKITRGHNWTGSCITFEDFSRHAGSDNAGFGEVSGFHGGDIDRVV